MKTRRDFLFWCLERLGADVLWASRGPLTFDCSGLVTCGIAELGGRDMRKTHNTDLLWAELERVTAVEAKPGDLVFWYSSAPGAVERGDVEHVAVLLAGGHVLTADGATPRVATIEHARAAGAMVTVRKSVNYRARFAGYRRLPLPETATP